MQIYFDRDERVLDPYRRVLIHSFKMEVLRLNRIHPKWTISYCFDNGPRCDIHFMVEDRQVKMLLRVFYNDSMHLFNKVIKYKYYNLPRHKFDLHAFGRTKFD